MMTETPAEMQRSPHCREHQILYGRLRADTKVYVDVTRRLESCKPEDFHKTYEAAQSARLAFLKARKTLALHVVIGANGNTADRRPVVIAIFAGTAIWEIRKSTTRSNGSKPKAQSDRGAEIPRVCVDVA